MTLVSYLLRRSPTGRARSSAYVEYRLVYSIPIFKKNLASNDLPLLERYVETENGIEEESSMFLRYLYYSNCSPFPLRPTLMKKGSELL